MSSSAFDVAVKCLQVSTDPQLVEMGGNIYRLLGSSIPAKKGANTVRPYASLELAYVILGRPALASDRHRFSSKSGASDLIYFEFVDALRSAITHSNMQALPHSIHTVENLCAALEVPRLVPFVADLLQECCKKAQIHPKEAENLILPALICCLKCNLALYGSRSSFLKLDELAKVLLTKKKTLQEHISKMEGSCDKELTTLKKDSVGFMNALTEMQKRLEKSSICRIPISTSNSMMMDVDNFEVVLEPAETDNGAPISSHPKRRPENLLDGLYDTWGPRGLLPLIPFEATQTYLHYQQTLSRRLP